MTSQTSYVYDGLNRLTGETLGAVTNAYAYDDYSNRQSLTADGVTTNYVYDANDRLLSDANASYTYDANGNLTQTVLGTGDTAQTVSCTYDNFNRLKKVSDNTGDTVYTYDADGLRSSKTTDEETERYVWDGGQLVATIGGWRALAQVTMPSDGAAQTIPLIMETGKCYYAVVNGELYSDYVTIPITPYSYIPPEDGEETPEVPPGVIFGAATLEFGPVKVEDAGDRIVDDELGVHEYIASVTGPANATISLYVSESDVKPAAYTRGLGLIAATEVDRGVTYYHYNAHGDVVQLTDSTGALVKDYRYDAFGVEQNADDNDANPFRYCGEQYDGETGNYYLRARYYTPGAGRFTQEDTHWNPGNMVYGDDPQKWNEYQSWLDESDRDDPLGLHTYTYKPEATAIAQAGNLYAYCGGNPLMYRDPTGSEWYHWVIGGVIVAVAAAAVVITAGGVVPAMYAVSAVASGAAMGSAVTAVAAGAFIGASMTYGSAAFMAALNSGSIKDFNRQGNWGVVVSTAAGAGLGSLYGYVLERGPFLRSLKFSEKQLQKKYKHAGDYGVQGSWSSKNGIAFEKAIRKQMQSTEYPILGTYRGTIQVYHFYDPKTGLDTMIKPDGSFLAGWKLSSAQVDSLLRTGNVQ